MESKPLSKGVQYTSTGHPYIGPLPTESPIPIYLTSLYAKDKEAMHRILNIPAVYLHLISIPFPYTLENAEWWITHQISGDSNLPLQALRSGAPDESGEFIGSVSLMPSDSEALKAVRDATWQEKIGPDEGECELGYYLTPEWRGKGIMSAGVKALVKWGKENGEKNVIVKVLEENTASRKVVEGKGWERLEGRDGWVDWPEQKGGGRKRLWVWRWVE